MKTSLVASGLAAAVAVSAAAGAMAAPAPPPSDALLLKEGVRAVVQVTAMDLDVVATKDGLVVRDLRKEELKVSVNGKAVATDFFSRVDEGTLHGPDLATASPDMILQTIQGEEGDRFVPRQFLLLFDDLHLLPQERPRIVEAFRDFVTRMAPSDRMSIVSLGTTTRVMVPFTSSKETLLDGLTRLEKVAPPGFMWDLQYRQQVQDLRRTPGSAARSGMIRTWAEQVRAREDGTLQELQRAVSALAGRSGKRILLLVSRGFELQPGQTLTQSLAPGLQQFDYSVRGAFQKVLDEANRGGVTIHALDGRGLVAEGDASESSPPLRSTFFETEARREALSGLAEGTGGTLVFERNVLAPSLDRIYRESGSYYLVGVTLGSLDPKKATYDLKVTTTRPGVKLAARKSYAPMSADDASRARVEMALMNPDASGDFPISLQVGASSKGGAPGRRLSPFTVRFPIGALTFNEGGGFWKTTVEISIAAVEDNGARSGITASRVPISIPDASRERAEKDGLAYSGEMKSRTGNFRFVATVRDLASGRTGIASSSVRVP